jgi:hypothetical protein
MTLQEQGDQSRGERMVIGGVRMINTSTKKEKEKEE